MAKETTTEKVKYTLSIETKLFKEGESVPMADSSITWNGLGYVEATTLEDILTEAMSKTIELGYAGAVVKGVISEDDLAKHLATVDKIKGKKK